MNQQIETVLTFGELDGAQLAYLTQFVQEYDADLTDSSHPTVTMLEEEGLTLGNVLRDLGDLSEVFPLVSVTARLVNIDEAAL